jgi:hypothetical protein
MLMADVVVVDANSIRVSFRQNALNNVNVVVAGGSMASGGAYYPPQAPPGSGFNSFTDTSGMVWVSYNGSAWKRALDGLHARVYRAGAYNIPGSNTIFPFDTVSKDVYGLWSAAQSSFVTPIPGVYRVTAQWVGAIPSGSWINAYLYVNGAQVTWGGAQPWTNNGYVPTGCNDTFWLSAGDKVALWSGAGGAVPAVVNVPGQCYMVISYAGTG